MYYLSPGGWEKHPSALREPARNISRRIFTWLQRSRKTACRLFPRGYRPVSLSLRRYIILYLMKTKAKSELVSSRVDKP